MYIFLAQTPQPLTQSLGTIAVFGLTDSVSDALPVKSQPNQLVFLFLFQLLVMSHH